MGIRNSAHHIIFILPKFQYHFRTDPAKLQEMLSLRSEGWSYQALADKYQCPKLTIRYLARKNDMGGATISVTVCSSVSTRTTTFSTGLMTVSGTQPEERVNPGKTYKEYLKEEQERSYRRLMNNA